MDDAVTVHHGTDHVVLDIGGRSIVRVPRHAEAAARGARERRLTELLSRRLTIPVPVFDVVAPPSDSFPLGFSAYARLPGRPALGATLEPPERDRLASVLGSFLRSLHAIPVREAEALGIPRDDDPERIAWASQASRDLERAVATGHVEAALARATSAMLEDRPTSAETPTLIHGDFAAEHVLVTPDGAPSGVIDWADAVLGDPAQDLAGFVHWGGRAMLAAALDSYGPCPDDMQRRAGWFALCRALADVAFGLDEDRPEYVAAGQRALRMAARSR